MSLQLKIKKSQPLLRFHIDYIVELGAEGPKTLRPRTSPDWLEPRERHDSVVGRHQLLLEPHGLALETLELLAGEDAVAAVRPLALLADGSLRRSVVVAERVEPVDECRRDDVVRVGLQVVDELGVPAHRLGQRDDRVDLAVVPDGAVEPCNRLVDGLDDADRADAPVVAHLVRHVDQGADHHGQQDDDCHSFTPLRVVGALNDLFSVHIIA